MKQNKLKKAVEKGRIPVGHMIMEFGTRGIAKLLETSDIDFVVIDMEHSGFGLERVADLLAWLKATDIAPFVRVPQNRYHFLARVMDAGALGVMVANVESAGQAREIVKAVKYAPLGQRGVGLGTAHTDYVQVEPATYFRTANENTTVICQIESTAGLSAAREIAAVDGVDVLWVGHFDLTQSMGIPGQFDEPRFHDALKTVVAAAEASGKLAAIQAGNWEKASEWLSMGFRILSWRTDIVEYRSALQQDIRRLRKLAASSGPVKQYARGN